MEFNFSFVIYVQLLAIMGKIKRDTGFDYTVIDLGGKSPGDDLEDCMKVRCTNKKSLEEVTGIKYDRLVYLFAKCHKSYVVENSQMIIKTTTVWKGSQPGGIRNKGLYQRGNY